MVLTALIVLLMSLLFSGLIALLIYVGRRMDRNEEASVDNYEKDSKRLH